MSKRSAPVDQNTIRRRGVGVTALDRERAYPGYTLFAPLTANGKVYLVDLEGVVVHEWHLPYAPGQTTYLLPNGNLFYNGKLPGSHDLFPVWSAYRGGVVLEADPKGNIVWEFRRPDHHHDASRLKNGGALVLGLEVLEPQFAATLIGGRPGSEHHGRTYQDTIYEVNAKGEIIWTWRAHEHLSVESAVIHPQESREHWPMANSVNELSDGNILVSFRNVSNVAIIERVSGKVLWSLDHPVVSQQHYPHELPNGNLLIFDNGSYRSDRSFPFSRIIEVDRKTKEVVWQYVDNPPQNFFSPYMSSGQRLPNGNTLVTEASFGRIFEVTSDGQIVWEYRVPFFGDYEARPDLVTVNVGQQNAVHRAFRYSAAQIPWL